MSAVWDRDWAAEASSSPPASEAWLNENEDDTGPELGHELVTPSDEAFVPAGEAGSGGLWVPGAERVANPRSRGGTYVGGPWRIVFHTVEGRPSASEFRRLAARRHTPPHLWAMPSANLLLQTIPLDRSAYALARPGQVHTNRRRAVQVEVWGHARDMVDAPPEVLDWLATRVLAPVAQLVPVNLANVRPAGDVRCHGLRSACRMSAAQWHDFDGVCGHKDVPDNAHWDPGGLDMAGVAARARARLAGHVRGREAGAGAREAPRTVFLWPREPVQWAENVGPPPDGEDAEAEEWASYDEGDAFGDGEATWDGEVHPSAETSWETPPSWDGGPAPGLPAGVAALVAVGDESWLAASEGGESEYGARMDGAAAGELDGTDELLGNDESSGAEGGGMDRPASEAERPAPRTRAPSVRRRPAGRMPLLRLEGELEEQLPPATTLSYEQVLSHLRRELALRFADPKDPRLFERRRRLRLLFSGVPAARTHQLHARLGERATRDELSRMFHGRLATATRRELLQILRNRFPATAPPPQPVPPTPAQVWPSRPLPPAADQRFRAALDALKLKVAGTNDPRAWRYRCWLAKLEAGADDRVVEWHRICPRTTGAIGAAYVVGPCDITAGSAVDQAELQAAITSVADVEGANQRLGFITHMRSEILFNHEMTSPTFHLENFQRFHDEVGRAVDKLDLWANNQMGGSSAMPKAYVALKDWIGAQQRDARSIYSCL